MSDSNRSPNRILSALSCEEYDKLQPKLERIPLTYNDNIYEPGEVIHYVYFPESGIVSLLSSVDDDSTLEIGLVGSEGIVGLPVFLGVRSSVNTAVVQGAGMAMRMATLDFANDGDGLSPYILRYMHALLTQVTQSAACNRFHTIKARLARWLLMTHDRMNSDRFRMTQEFLSNMIGVRREAVNKAANALQQEGIITYSRGNLLISDRPALENAACNCYGIIKEEFDRLYV